MLTTREKSSASRAKLQNAISGAGENPAPEIAFCGFAQLAEDFWRVVRTYRRAAGLTMPCPFPTIIIMFLEGAWRGRALVSTYRPRRLQTEARDRQRKLVTDSHPKKQVRFKVDPNMI